MSKTYADYAREGLITAHEAAREQRARQAGRDAASTIIGDEARHGGSGGAMAFGMLDAVVVHLQKWYGADAVAEVLAHYAQQCRKHEGKGDE